ncbi:MAG: hypothetical protein E6J09_05995 [Chloroflexi bacterium]|nr:MAG: hypothetical protein E6J09_05995 [Chloroflexota bacterium]
MIAVHRAFTYVFVILVFACGGTSSTPPTPSATAIAAPSSPTPTRPPRAIFPSVTTSAGVIWEPTDEPPGPPVEGVRWWAKGTWPDGNTTIAAVYAPPGDGPFPAVVYLHEAAGLTQAQLDVARKISAGGFIVVAGCRFELARVPCKRRLNLYETSAAFVDFAKAFPNARRGTAALVGASAGSSEALYLTLTRNDISAIVADSGVGIDYPKVPVLVLASRADSLIANSVEQSQAFEAEMRARGGIVESHYYDIGGHIVLVNAQTTDDAIQRVIAFLSKYVTR